MSVPTINDLRQVIALRDMPDAHLQWIFDHAIYVEYEEGAVIMKTGEAAEFMMFIIEGIVSFYMNKNGTLVHYFDFGNDETSGGATGLLPYSRMKTSPGTSFAVGKLRSFRLHKNHFGELEQLNPELIERLVAYMTDRAKSFATLQLQQEKVSALGKLAAGIAHELNNPAAAINRIAAELTKRLQSNYTLTEKVLQSDIQPEHIQNIQLLVKDKDSEQKQKTKQSAMQRIEAEDILTEWLVKNNFNDLIKTVELFIDRDFSIDDFEKIKTEVGSDAFVSVLSWLENLLTSQRLLKDLNDASCRISTLVGAIKSHVQMDRTNDVQPTNLHKDLDNTITLLGYKLREKTIFIKKDYCDNMAIVEAYIGELNQVWTNLIDNAIFALDKDGELCIETSCNEKNVIVKIIDNGPGIPKEIQSRIFDAFFTTKKVGEGTGIGLDLVNRIVKHHNGEIKLNSVPGRTEFAVIIPVSQKQIPK
ncbi:MAG: ATP-binding protein [Bacteroidia bacterium]